MPVCIKCKECTKAKSRSTIAKAKQDPEWRQKERKRCRDASNLKRKMGLEKKMSREKDLEIQRRWQSSNKEKVFAHRVSQDAVAKGILVKPHKCEHCQTPTADLEKHHNNYSKPLEVTWLCVPCHAKTRRKAADIPIGYTHRK